MATFGGTLGPSRSYASGGTVIPGGGGGVYAAGGAIAGGTRTAGADVDLGCAGVFCEPDGMQVSEGNFEYIGTGRGNYEMVQQLTYVGAGGDYDKERMVSYNGWKCRTCCIVFLILLFLAGIGGILAFFLIPTGQEERDETVLVTLQDTQPFDCQAGLLNWEKAWSVEKKTLVL